MTANRIIPYGYKVVGGENLPHPQESEIVRRIYADYLGSQSLLKIAQRLTAEGIEFIPGRHDWNKNRIKRILEDGRYTGTSTYPQIIPEDMQPQVRAVKDSNNTTTSENPFRLTCPVECSCGGRMTRRHDSRNQITERWQCQNPDCGRLVPISDSDLLARITDTLNRLIDNPNLVTVSPDTAEIPPEVRRLQNEVNRQLDGIDFDKDSVKAAIFSLAAERFRTIDTDHTISHILRAAFEESAPLSEFSEGLFKRTVNNIQFSESGTPGLVLKNHQTIEGSKPDASDSDDRRATA